MEKTAFEIGVEQGLKEAAFGVAPVAGAVKSVGGVTKKLVDGKWVDHAPAAGGGLMDKIRGLFKSQPAPTAWKPRGPVAPPRAGSGMLPA